MNGGLREDRFYCLLQTRCGHALHSRAAPHNSRVSGRDRGRNSCCRRSEWAHSRAVVGRFRTCQARTAPADRHCSGPEGKTIIMVTHDEYLLQYATRIIRMHDGSFVEEGAVR